MSLNKLKLDFDLKELEPFLTENNIEIIDIKFTHLYRLTSLPFIHRDPFDRLLISQCIEEGFTFLTKDENIVLYDEVLTLW